MNIKRIFAAASAVMLTAVAVPAVAFAATTTQVVTPTNSQGFAFNPDPTNATPYNFTEDQASIGEGSLYVQPIGSDPLAKFIASKAVGVTVPNFESVSYDFQIAGTGTVADADQYYLNVYVNTVGSSTFYDCRYDYVPTTGSTTEFTTATFSPTSTPSQVGDRADAFTCPATLAELPADAVVKAIALNVGDTSATDAGLAGYFDKVVITTAADTTTYDFEEDLVKLASKDDCKNGGWATSEAPVFKNQGDCVSSFASNGKAKGNVVTSVTSALSRLF